MPQNLNMLFKTKKIVLSSASVQTHHDNNNIHSSTTESALSFFNALVDYPIEYVTVRIGLLYIIGRMMFVLSEC